MRKQDIYRLLEAKMLSYLDYADIPVVPNGEKLVALPASDTLIGRQIGTDMQPYTGELIFVRQDVLQRLQQAAQLLTMQTPQLKLEVVYGYRALEVQTRLFNQLCSKLQDQYSGEALSAAVHRLVAVPEVAGHPAGAAVDIQIIQDGEPINFGTKIHQLTPDTFTFSPFISKEAWANRQLLRRVMMQAGFAPFDGEWWHFSYGDKEWAKYYDEESALYEQVHFKC